jgi:hypothetical protein
MKTYKIHRGQVALVMVLIMTVISAVVVSVASKATNEAKVQRLSTESNDAFMTAQTGLEEALSKKTSIASDSGDKSYSVELVDNGQNGLVTEIINPGTSIDIVLNKSTILTALKIYWRPSTALDSAIFVSKIAGNVITDYAYDTVGLNGFTKANDSGVSSFPYATSNINVDSSVDRVRITVLGDASFLNIEPIGDTLPVQTSSYKSVAAIGGGSESVKYGLLYEESKDARTPEVFDYALFSYGTIIQ